MESQRQHLSHQWWETVQEPFIYRDTGWERWQILFPKPSSLRAKDKAHWTVLSSLRDDTSNGLVHAACPGALLWTQSSCPSQSKKDISLTYHSTAHAPSITLAWLEKRWYISLEWRVVRKRSKIKPLSFQNPLGNVMMSINTVHSLSSWCIPAEWRNRCSSA